MARLNDFFRSENSLLRGVRSGNIFKISIFLASGTVIEIPGISFFLFCLSFQQESFTETGHDNIERARHLSQVNHNILIIIQDF